MRITFEAEMPAGASVIHVVEPTLVEDGRLIGLHNGIRRNFALSDIHDIYCTETAQLISVVQCQLACEGCDRDCAWLIRN